MAARWLCEVCGYVHEGQAPPDECPICGVGPDLFSPHQEVAEPEPPAAPAKQWRCTVCDFVHEGDAPPEECPVCGVDASMFVAEGPAEHEQPAAITSSSGGRLVIVGAGVAGVTAAEHARRQSADLEITLIHKEPDLPYNRLNLTRFIAGEVDPTQLDLRGRQWYGDHPDLEISGPGLERQPIPNEWLVR